MLDDPVLVLGYLVLDHKNLVQIVLYPLGHYMMSSWFWALEDLENVVSSLRYKHLQKVVFLCNPGVCKISHC